jgi:chemotaxis protein MotC
VRRRVRSLLAAIALVAAGSVPTGAQGPADPAKLVRTLELLQDSIAHGSGAPEDARRKLIDVIGESFLSADPKTWTDERSADAALLYVLNGGHPAVLARLPMSEEGSPRAALVAAVAAYAAGSRAEAMRLWDEVDLAPLPASLAGSAALALANLVMDADPERALRLVDVARLESPGTLVEEAATRRGIDLATRLGRPERFEFYAIAYVSRFPRSPYSAAFRRLLSHSYLKLAAVPDAAPRLDEILSVLPAEERIGMYLDVARLAVVQADMMRAAGVAETALGLSQTDTTEMRRAELYRTAADAFVGDPVAARERLEAMRAADFPQDDVELLNAVLSVVEQIQRWPTAEGDAEPPALEQAGLGAAGDASAPVDDILTRAEAVMASATRVLEEAEY